MSKMPPVRRSNAARKGRVLIRKRAVKITSRLARISIARDARAISNRTPIRAISRIDEWLARIQILSGTAVRALPGRDRKHPKTEKDGDSGPAPGEPPATGNLMYPVVAVNATGSQP